MDASRSLASWVPVTSSNVLALLFFMRLEEGRKVGVLAVRYRDGTVYEYTANQPGGTSRGVYLAMQAAPSKGRFRWNVLKPPEYTVVGPLPA